MSVTKEWYRSEFVNHEMQLLYDTELESIHFCFRLIMKELSPKVKENTSLIVENKNDFFAYCLYKMNRYKSFN